MEASRDSNYVTTLLAVSSVDGVTPVTLYANPTTHRLLVDLAGGGSGTVQTVAVATANGFAGTSDGNSSAPTITITTSITGILKGDGTAISAVTIGSGLSYDGTTLSATGSGTGDVVGPASATDNAIARYDTTTGKLIQNSVVLIADTTGVISGTQGVTFTGATSGTTSLVPTAIASGTQTLPATTGTLVNRVTTANGVSASNTDGALSITLGAITPSTVNGNTFTTGSSTYTGTAGQTYTFPSTTATLARIDAANTFVGASTASAWVLTSPTITTSIVPTSNNGAALGNITNQFSDLFLAEGGVINWDNGDMTITQVGNVMTIAGGNVLNNNLISSFTTTATAAGTTTLTVDSTHFQFFTGSTTQTVTLPVTSTLTTGHSFFIKNTSSGVVTVNSSGSNLVASVAAGASVYVTCILTSGTTAASWNANLTALFYAAGKTLTINNSLTFSGTDGTTMTFPGSSDTVATLAATQTFTNKRITKRTGTTTSSATPTINTDNVDEYYITAQTVDITSFTTNLSGTPTQGQMLFISVIGTAARAITWGASFGNGPVALPTTTVTTTELSVLFKWDGSVWRCYASGSRV